MSEDKNTVILLDEDTLFYLNSILSMSDEIIVPKVIFIKYNAFINKTDFKQLDECDAHIFPYKNIDDMDKLLKKLNIKKIITFNEKDIIKLDGYDIYLHRMGVPKNLDINPHKKREEVIRDLVNNKDIGLKKAYAIVKLGNENKVLFEGEVTLTNYDTFNSFHNKILYKSSKTLNYDFKQILKPKRKRCGKRMAVINMLNYNFPEKNLRDKIMLFINKLDEDILKNIEPYNNIIMKKINEKTFTISLEYKLVKVTIKFKSDKFEYNTIKKSHKYYSSAMPYTELSKFVEHLRKQVKSTNAEYVDF